MDPAGPRPAGGFDHQLGGPRTPPPGVSVVTRDRHRGPRARPALHLPLNGSQAQPEESPWWRSNHPGALPTTAGGDHVVDPDWNEVLLDTSSDAGRVSSWRAPTSTAW